MTRQCAVNVNKNQRFGFMKSSLIKNWKELKNQQNSKTPEKSHSTENYSAAHILSLTLH